MAKNLQENIVPAENQNVGSVFLDEPGDDIRVLFVGNSITKHAPKPQIGWTRDCGMAATCIDNDYVHILKRRILDIRPHASFGIIQVADFERRFETFDIQKEYRRGIDFDADIIIMFFGANVRKDYDDESDPAVSFGVHYRELRCALDTKNSAFVIHSQGFYIRNKLDEEKKAAAEFFGDQYVELGDIVTREETHGEFNHPSDKGMREIADKFWAVIEAQVRGYTPREKQAKLEKEI